MPADWKRDGGPADGEDDEADSEDECDWVGDCGGGYVGVLVVEPGAGLQTHHQQRPNHSHP